MLGKRKADYDYPPETKMAGVCATCKTEVRVKYQATQPPSGRLVVGYWQDVPSVECPTCKARVYVRPWLPTEGA